MTSEPIEPLAFDSEPQFRDSVFGTLGEFSTPSGNVGFLLARARLGRGGTDPEHRLAASIAPFREVTTADQLAFSELLQRDIDDFRVVDQLVPYLLRESGEGPAMFPPILCLVLPFDGPDLASTFPARQPVGIHNERGLHLQGWRHGDAFRVEELVTSSGGDYPMSVGRLSWNQERARVVVLDGQHRAMAMLAVQRTLNNTWEDGRGSKYRVFYERAVRRLLEKVGELAIDHLEVPVAICWFGEELGGRTPHQAARGLFVDVNREAKAPSPSRLTLLSESELLAIFARSILDRVRSDGTDGALPLAAIEFDNPERESYRPVKWSVVTTLDFIRLAVLRCVFGPHQLIDDAGSSASLGRGALPWEQMNRFMRSQLRISDLVPAEIDDGDRKLARESIGNKRFPRSKLAELTDAFDRSWGSSLIKLLSTLEPYAAHHRALERLRAGWETPDVQGRLAYDAIFEGVGMFWTLRSAHANWQSLGGEEEAQDDVVRAWQLLEQKRTVFDKLRAEEYLGDENATGTAARAYRSFNTAACQVGAVMAIASVALATRTARDDVPVLAERLIASWNAALHERRTIFDPEAEAALNQIQAMNTPMAVHFRYFWLELARVGNDGLDESSLEAIDVLIPAGRRAYMDLLVAQQIGALERTQPNLPEIAKQQRALSRARSQLGAALVHWFGWPQTTFDEWFIDYADSGSESEEDDNTGSELDV